MISTVLLASLAVFSWKILGYLVPERFITPARRELADRVTVALLAALIMLQTFSIQQSLVVDARLASVLVAGVLLALRVPYIFVVLAGAITAALLRYLGL